MLLNNDKATAFGRPYNYISLGCFHTRVRPKWGVHVVEIVNTKSMGEFRNSSVHTHAKIDVSSDSNQKLLNRDRQRRRYVPGRIIDICRKRDTKISCDCPFILCIDMLFRLWYIIAKSLGIKLHPLDRPIISSIVHLLTCGSAAGEPIFQVRYR